MKRVTLRNNEGVTRIVIVCETRDEFLASYMPHINNMCKKLSYGTNADGLLSIAFDCVDKMFATLAEGLPPSTQYFDKIFRNEVAGIARTANAELMKSTDLAHTDFTFEELLPADPVSNFVEQMELAEDEELRKRQEEALLAYLDVRPTLKQDLLNCIIHRDKGPGFQKAIKMLRELLNDRTFLIK